MSNFFNLVLDTTAPSGVSISLENGATYATGQIINAIIATSDPDTTGYQMKIWGDVDPSYDSNVQATEGASAWITYDTLKQIKLSEGDGNKTIYIKIRDDVQNVSAQASDTIALDTTPPIPNVTVGPDVTKVSKVSGKDACAFSFSADVQFEEYKVKVVPTSNSLHTAGTQIGSTNGSTNMYGNAGNYPANTNVDCIIKGADLEAASAGDGQKIIKVFVKDVAGNWSI